jgi:spore coat polysaccharide biosynthesis protein SpsF
MPAAGKPLLAHLVERLKQARSLSEVTVATTENAADDAIVALAKSWGVRCFRGSEFDCLDRYDRAATEFDAKYVVRITSDCPLIDPGLVDEMVALMLANPGAWDLVTNRHPLTFPDGLDVDIMPRVSLARAAREATTPQQREHTIPYFWEGGLRVRNVEDPSGLFWTQRWTLDYPEDYRLIHSVFDALYPKNPRFGRAEILAFLDANPDVASLNAMHLPSRE